MPYYLIESGYSMKCRLYPNKTQAKAIDDAIYAVQSFYNCTLYEIFNNFACCVEKPKKEGDGVVHFLKPGDLAKAERKNRLAEEHPAQKMCPAKAISSSVYGVTVDIQKSIDVHKPIEFQKPRYYSKSYPRTSYGTQETFSKLTIGNNENVMWFEGNRIGKVKMRGWNKKIRFDPDGMIDFPTFAAQNKRANFGCTISRDNCGDYWISFMLQNVYKWMADAPETEVGVDVGVKDLAITSDGTKYQNKHFAKLEKKRKAIINRRLSSRWGWSNIKFREAHKKDTTIECSIGYNREKLKLAKLSRKIARKRELYNHEVSRHIVENANFIGVESLNVKGMAENKHLAYDIADVAIRDLLTDISYKAEWHGRTCYAIGQWTPSSKTCSVCGWKYDDLKLSTRSWTCPACGTRHDRDVNAANNILRFAKEQREKEMK